mmetsp:Transcript_12570/g.41986  ORF Transcript_12570/g.41986 Transcript_12570/m.41986 type:complete len:290 (-) Transcript_12570:958-1827(-)
MRRPASGSTLKSPSLHSLPSSWRPPRSAALSAACSSASSRPPKPDRESGLLRRPPTPPALSPLTTSFWMEMVRPETFARGSGLASQLADAKATFASFRGRVASLYRPSTRGDTEGVIRRGPRRSSAKVRCASSEACCTAVWSLAFEEASRRLGTIKDATSLSVKPAATPRCSSPVAARINLRHGGRRPRASRSMSASAAASRARMCFLTCSHNGARTAGQSIQHQSNHSISKTSGKMKPWSIGTTSSLVDVELFFQRTKRFAELRSQLSARMSRAATACNRATSSSLGP